VGKVDSLAGIVLVDLLLSQLSLSEIQIVSTRGGRWMHTPTDLGIPIFTDVLLSLPTLGTRAECKFC
jgi:hypothetical protein